jgi:hypothetical protein
MLIAEGDILYLHIIFLAFIYFLQFHILYKKLLMCKNNFFKEYSFRIFLEFISIYLV